MIKFCLKAIICFCTCLNLGQALAVEPEGRYQVQAKSDRIARQRSLVKELEVYDFFGLSMDEIERRFGSNIDSKFGPRWGLTSQGRSFFFADDNCLVSFNLLYKDGLVTAVRRQNLFGLTRSEGKWCTNKTEALKSVIEGVSEKIDKLLAQDPKSADPVLRESYKRRQRALSCLDKANP